MRNERGFTLIELILVIVVLGIMAALAIPKFLDMRGDAKKSAVQGSLGGVRSAVANYRASQVVKGLTPELPTLASVTDGTSVLDGPIPDNPYSTQATKNSVEDAQAASGTKGTAGCGNSSTKGWCYRPDNGQFWASTNVAGENAF